MSNPITLEMVRTYVRYKGDGDAWARSRRRDSMTDVEWATIDGFVQDLHLVRNNLASASFGKALEQRMLAACQDRSVIEAIKAIRSRQESRMP